MTSTTPTLRSTEPSSLRVAVTGAAGGIGTAVVNHLRAQNCIVGAIDVDFRLWDYSASVGVTLITADLADPKSARQSIDQVARSIGGLDAVVHAAALLDNLHRAYRMQIEDWERELNINLSAAFRVAQASYPYIRHSENGRVVFVSSVAAEDGQPGQVAYSASKAGLVGMMRTLAAEWSVDRITCNAVLPGFVDTPKVKRLPQPIRDAFLRRVPLSRFASPEEIAGTIAFLLSPAAAYLTGTAIRVDGGFGLNQLALAVGRQALIDKDPA